MLFKQAHILRFTKPFAVTAEQLADAMQEDAFKPCQPSESFRQGWVPPLGKFSEQLVHAGDGCFMVCQRREEKILPAAVVNDAVAERVDAIEHEQNRKVRKKERDELKDQVIMELLPQAFTRRKHTFAFLCLADGLLVIDAAPKQAEELASSLRKSLGSLPVRPLCVEQSPAFTFTGWLNETLDIPEQLTLGTDCWLADQGEEGGKVTGKGLDLHGDQVRSHLEAGMQATKLAVCWEDQVSFTIDENLHLSRLRFGDAFQEKLDDVDADDAAARFDAAFALMTRELRRIIPGLLSAMGGEDRTAIIEEGEEQVSVEHEDALYPAAVELVTKDGRVSITRFQREFRIGYNRAAHLVEAMEERGLVRPPDEKGFRQVVG